MLTIFRILIVLIVAGVASGCTKRNDDGFPEATHEGRNILAFRINGVAYVAQGVHDGRVGLFTNTYADAYLSPGDTAGSIIAYGTTPHHFTLIISLHRSSASQPFMLSTNGRDAQLVDNNDLFYNTDSTNSGQLIFTHVTDSVLAGTFNVAMTSKAGTVHLTDGRFDVGR